MGRGLFVRFSTAALLAASLSACVFGSPETIDKKRLATYRRIAVVILVDDRMLAHANYRSHFVYPTGVWQLRQRVERAVLHLVAADPKFDVVQLQYDPDELWQAFREQYQFVLGSPLASLMAPVTAGKDIDALIIVYPRPQPAPGCASYPRRCRDGYELGFGIASGRDWNGRRMFNAYSWMNVDLLDVRTGRLVSFFGYASVPLALTRIERNFGSYTPETRQEIEKAAGWLADTIAAGGLCKMGLLDHAAGAADEPAVCAEYRAWKEAWTARRQTLSKQPWEKEEKIVE